MTNYLHNLYLQIISEGTLYKKEFDEIAKNPGVYNTNLLLNILQSNASTEFGQLHNFASITSVEQYKNSMPITGYDNYDPYIKRMIQEQQDNLLTSYPIRHYMESSGTQGTAKYLPLSNPSKEIIHTLSKQLFSRIYDLMGDAWTYHKLLLLIVPADKTLNEYADRNSLSTELFIGIFEENMSDFVVSPMLAYEKGRTVDTQYLHAMFALIDANMCSIFSPFMSFILEFIHYVNINKEMLIQNIEMGIIDDSINISEEDCATLLSTIKPNKERAAQLREIFEAYPTSWPKKVWPNLELILSTCSGSFLECTEVVRTYVGNGVNILGLGFGSSECVFSMPVELNQNDAVLLPHTGFFEFLPLGENDYTKTLTLDEIEVGKDYEILVTTISGLYRYQMRDAVTVTGTYLNTPKIQFSHRIDQTVNIFGEKTSELLLRKIVYDMASENGLSIYNFSVYPDTTSAPMRYVFFIEFTDDALNISAEQMQESMEKKLRGANFLYDLFASSGKLAPLEIHILQKNSYINYNQNLLNEGKNISQIKPVRIISSAKIRDFFLDRIVHIKEEELTKLIMY
ncbi:MAG: GH3 auxin-responsive promoter family protein [Clostridiales bacterium]|nr:GH3 auxin-responsive promoter family protein [Clostridiales bacterium]